MFQGYFATSGYQRFLLRPFDYHANVGSFSWFTHIVALVALWSVEFMPRYQCFAAGFQTCPVNTFQSLADVLCKLVIINQSSYLCPIDVDNFIVAVTDEPLIGSNLA